MSMGQMKVQHHVTSGCSEEELLFLKQMGIQYVNVLFQDGQTDYDSVMTCVERIRKQGLIITDAGSRSIYKNPAIHLGLPGRDEAIERYNQFNRILAKAGIPVTYMTWEPNGVLSTAYAVGDHSRGAVCRLVDLKELEQRPYTHGRVFSKEEIWENFQYFLDRALPVCQEVGIKIALHPNDPPVPQLCGISNLITSAEDYKKAFALAKDSPYLGMKMCIGCWLEGGESFGKLLEDIRYFVEHDKVFIVHFRNVSGPVPCFEETLIEDGYMDMYQVMQTLVSCGYDGAIQVDHVPQFVEKFGGTNSSTAYCLGYMKGLLKGAVAQEGIKYAAL